VIIRENTELTEYQRRGVLERVEERNFTCARCGSGDFEVGEALGMGFLFLDEEHGTYMVALTCENPGCGSPRTGIRLHRSAFLWDE
jgi:hypothetical protein